jgi:hypothetical protein
VCSGDAPDLASSPAHHFGLVVFCIAYIDHEGRQLVLTGILRILRAGGLLVFSTLNKDSLLFGAIAEGERNTANTYRSSPVVGRASPLAVSSRRRYGSGLSTGGTRGGTCLRLLRVVVLRSFLARVTRSRLVLGDGSSCP